MHSSVLVAILAPNALLRLDAMVEIIPGSSDQDQDKRDEVAEIVLTESAEVQIETKVFMESAASRLERIAKELRNYGAFPISDQMAGRERKVRNDTGN